MEVFIFGQTNSTWWTFVQQLCSEKVTDLNLNSSLNHLFFFGRLIYSIHWKYCWAKNTGYQKSERPHRHSTLPGEYFDPFLSTLGIFWLFLSVLGVFKLFFRAFWLYFLVFFYFNLLILELISKLFVLTMHLTLL